MYLDVTDKTKNLKTYVINLTNRLDEGYKLKGLKIKTINFNISD